ncbi:M28 family peptidase [Blastopirellula marina]|uniref:Aminopeptidase n=1 Tax=Blastopirellula marina TaxID=124 RepID=A0A2S8GCG8_9BACT|nr:M28 family peptidase [Blastopirellula marina]PQO42162.1 aminopeptidase [Blastopirellula marina]
MQFFSSRSVRAFLLALSLISFPRAVSAQQQSDAAPTTVAAFAFSDDQIESRISHDLNFLASDEREGRGPYTKGLQAAAEYIAEQFRDAGLKTKLIEEGPFQVFAKRTYYDLGKLNKLAFTVEREDARLLSADDYHTLSPSISGKFDLPVAFAGYGISSEKDEYDDYADFDANGKMVIVLRHEPDQAGKTGKFAGAGNSKFAYLSTKIENAVEQGAAGVLIVSDELAIKKKQGQDELLEFQIRMPKGYQPKVPVFHVKRAAIDALLKRAGKVSLAEWENLVDTQWKPDSFDLDGVTASGEVEITSSERTQQNVLGVLPGKGELASEVVVVGAHYDHLGRGGSGSLAPWTRDIHNGADDNASGTIALLETARQCAAWDAPNRRTILFIAFGAEEQGLVGSEYYVRHPLYDLKKTVAMLNYDMVGRLRKERLTVYGHNTAKEFDAWLAEAAPLQGIEINKIGGGYGPSDHASFYGRGIPVMHDFTGFHSEYHRPSDDIEHINVPGIRKIVGMNMSILKHMATEPITPIVEEGGSLLDLYFGGGAEEDSPVQGRALGVAIGDFDDTGLPIKGVGKGSVAEKAGLRTGDVLVSWAGNRVKNIKELRAMINGAEVDQKVPVRIMRGTLELEIEVEFTK